MANQSLNNLSSMMNLDSEIGTGTKPPTLLKGEDFLDWKFKFRSFIKYTDPKLWRSIEKGPHVPMAVKDDGTTVPKDPDLYVEEDIALIEKDDKAYASITMALSTEVAQGFKEYETAQDLWNALVERYEGNSDM